MWEWGRGRLPAWALWQRLERVRPATVRGGGWCGLNRSYGRWGSRRRGLGHSHRCCGWRGLDNRRLFADGCGALAAGVM